MNSAYFLLLVIYIVLPIYLLYKKEHVWLTYWLMQGVFVDIFSVQFHGNLSSFKIAGLLLVPYTFRNIKKYVLENKAGNFLGLFMLWLVLSFLLSGFIWQPAEIKMTDYLRGIKQIMTFMSELSIGMYLAKRISEGHGKSIVRGAIIGMSLSIMGIFLERIFSYDLYSLFTNGRELLLENRMRGFAFEPRAASQHSVFMIFALIISNNISVIKKCLLGTIVTACFYLTNSMTGIVLLPLGISLVVLVRILKNGISLKTGIISLASLFVIVLGIYNFLPAHISRQISERSYILKSKNLVDRFEPAEATVVNYLIKNPQRLMTGIGTGFLASVSKEYVTDKWSSDWGNGVQYLPFMGVILQLSNMGFLGLALWIIFIFLSGRDLWKRESLEVNQIFITVMILYFFQVRYFHVVGLALAFSLFLKKTESLSKSA